MVDDCDTTLLWWVKNNIDVSVFCDTLYCVCVILWQWAWYGWKSVHSTWQLWRHLSA